MKWAALLLACGCNELFGLDPTTPIDAFGPPPPPPPAECPAIGVVPTFRGQVQKLPIAGCTSYTVGTSGAMAVCGGVVMRGEIDLAVSPVTITTPPAFIIDARVAPDVERFLLTTTIDDAGRTNLVFLEYQLQPDRSWIGAPGYTLGQIASSISTPSMGPDRRAVFGGDGSNLHEIGDDGTAAGWSGRTDHVLAAAMDRAIQQPSLSPDGRRLVFILADDHAQQEGIVYYADRASIDDAFVVARPVESVPIGIAWPHMTADCGRLYYSALGSVFYAEQ